MSALREVFARFTTDFDDRELRAGARSASALTDQIRTLGAALVGYFGIQAIRSFVSESASIGDELDKTSKVIGISIQDLQSWRHAADLSGVGASAFNAGVARLQRNMLDASQGLKTAQRAFQQLGVEFQNSDGQLRPVQDVLRDMADPLANLESSSERVGLLMQLMGRSGARMGPLFAEGAEGVDRMRAELAELGGGASSEFIQSAADLTDANARLDLALLGLRSRIGTTLLPMIQSAVEWFARLVSQTRILESFMRVVLSAALAKITMALVAMGREAVIARAKMVAGWGAIAAAIFLATILVEDFVVALEGGDSMFGTFNESLRDFFEINREGEGVIADLSRQWEGLVELVEEAIAAIAVFTGMGSGVPDRAEFTDQRGLQSPEEARRRAAEIESGERRARRAASIVRASRGLGAVDQTGRTVDGSGGRRRALGGAPERFTDQRGLTTPPSAPTVNQNVNVTVNGGDPAEVQRVVRREMDRANRDAVASLAFAGES